MYCRIALGANTSKQCRVHPKFKAVVIVDSQAIRSSKIPPPLLNRMEKQTLDFNDLLSGEDRKMEQILYQWCQQYAKQDPGKVFLGFHRDNLSAMLLHFKSAEREKQIRECLLMTVTPESVILAHANGDKNCFHSYFNEQPHDCLANFVDHFLQGSLVQSLVMTQSSSSVSLERLLPKIKFTCIKLHTFDTEFDFSVALQKFFSSPSSLLLLQINLAQVSKQRVLHAKYVVSKMLQNQPNKKGMFVVHMSTTVTDFYFPFDPNFTVITISDLETSEQLNLPSIQEFFQHSLEEILGGKVPSFKMRSYLMSHYWYALSRLNYPAHYEIQDQLKVINTRLQDDDFYFALEKKILTVSIAYASLYAQNLKQAASDVQKIATEGSYRRALGSLIHSVIDDSFIVTLQQVDRNFNIHSYSRDTLSRKFFLEVMSSDLIPLDPQLTTFDVENDAKPYPFVSQFPFSFLIFRQIGNIGSECSHPFRTT